MVLRLFFDTETNGLPKYDKIPAIDGSGNWPDIISICWMLYEDDTKKKQEYTIIKPYFDGWNEKSEEVHGISRDEADISGSLLASVLTDFMADVRACDQIIAHNLYFDKNVILNAVKWNMNGDISFWDDSKEFCTLVNARNGKNLLLPINENREDISYTLDNLYRYAFKVAEAPKDAHNALRDVEVLKDVFFELSKPGGPFAPPKGGRRRKTRHRKSRRISKKK